MNGTIAEITIFPIKSTGGLKLSSALVEARGLQHDRRFMVVDRDGKFITVREQPSLLRISCQPHEDNLIIKGPNRDTLSVSTNPTSSVVSTTVWRSSVNARTVSPAADEWFSDYLGFACQLVYMAVDSHRAVDPDYGRSDDEVSFADGYPVLIVSRAALNGLNERLDQPVGMRRFRPNLVIDGCEAHAEDEWRRVRIGNEVELELVKHCSRCVLTTFDPETVDQHPQREPLRTLATYRRFGKRGVYFGMNAIPRRVGTVRVGDTITVLEGGNAG